MLDSLVTKKWSTAEMRKLWNEFYLKHIGILNWFSESIFEKFFTFLDKKEKND